MPAIGAEIDQLVSLQSCFNNESNNVSDLTQTIRNQLQGTVWQGPAADRFRSAWSGEFEPMLNKLSAALVDAGTEVSKRREALIQAGS